MAMATYAQIKSLSKKQKSNIYEACEVLYGKQTWGKKRCIITMAATDAQNKSRRRRNQTFTRPVSSSTRHKKQKRWWEQLSMAMATCAQNTSRRHSNQIIYETYEHLNAIQKTEAGKKRRRLWLPTYKTHSEDAEINTSRNLWASNTKDRSGER